MSLDLFPVSAQLNQPRRIGGTAGRVGWDTLSPRLLWPVSILLRTQKPWPDLRLTRAPTYGADDGNRTRAISLGIGC